MRRIPARNVVLALGASTQLPDDAAHYVRDVLRLAVGTVVEVFDGEGAAYRGPIQSLDPLVVRLEDRVDTAAMESPCRVRLFQAIPKKDRFEWLLEKATELGVSAIVPLHTARGVVQIPDDKRDARRERWQRICDAAARQCGRSQSPVVECVTALREVRPRPSSIVLDPTGIGTLADAVRGVTQVDVFIGPEGGFDPAELTWLGERATPCRIGPRVLRSETAGIAALTVIQAMTGGLD